MAQVFIFIFGLSQVLEVGLGELGELLRFGSGCLSGLLQGIRGGFAFFDGLQLLGLLLKILLALEDGDSSESLGIRVQLLHCSEVLEGVVSEQLAGISSLSSKSRLDLSGVDDSEDVSIGELGSGKSESLLG